MRAHEVLLITFLVVEFKLSSSATVRLKPGPDYGRVEIYVSDEWVGFDRRYGWDKTAAEVVCRELGYSYGKTTYTTQDHSFKVKWTHVACVGNEISITNCSKQDCSSCPGWMSAGVVCYNESGLQLRLNPGPDFGLVEVALNGKWGTASGRYNLRNNVNVICKQLGYSGGVRQSVREKVGEGSIPQWISRGVNCRGSESIIFDCPDSTGFGVSPEHEHDLNVRCFSETKTIVTSASYRYGEVVVYESLIEKGYICDEGWDDADAKVACRMLGYTNGSAHTGSTFKTALNSKTYYMRNVDCHGNETNLEDCARIVGGTCQGHQEHVGMNSAGVSCFNDTDENEFLSKLFHLSAKNDVERLVLHHHMVYGDVCDPTWTQEDATVLCRLKGMDSGLPVKGKDLVGESTPGSYDYPIWRVNFTCTGQETDLNDCSSEPVGDHSDDCLLHQHFRVGGLCWKSNASYSDVHTTIVGSPGRYGLVKVFYKDIGGYIYADPGKWTKNESDVVCREHGFSSSYPIEGNIMYSGTAPLILWIKNLKCNGSETNIRECTYESGFNNSTWTLAQSNHVIDYKSRRVEVVCYNEPNTEVNLQVYSKYNSDDNYLFGRLDVLHVGVTGTVCNMGFDDADAVVACKQLGFKNGVRSKTRGIQRIPWLSNLRCHGNETRLTDCSHDGLASNLVSAECSQQQHSDAGVFCYNSDKDYYEEYRLRGGAWNWGYLEVTIAGLTGTVCYSHVKAYQLCRQFGYVYASSFTKDYGKGRGPVLVQFDHGSPCSHVGNILDCRVNQFGDTYCHHNHGLDGGVLCSHSSSSQCQNKLIDLSEAQGVIQSGSPDSYYVNNRKCSWRVSVAKPYVVALSFVKFKTYCPNDFVDVRDGTDSLSPLIVPTLCGSGRGINDDPLVSTENSMYIQFTSDNSGTTTGFVANYRRICLGLDVFIDSGETIMSFIGNTFKILNVSSEQCQIECDFDEYCKEMYYEVLARRCILDLASYYGPYTNLTNVSVITFTRSCTPCERSWSDPGNGLLSGYKFSIDYYTDVTSFTACQKICTDRAYCVSVSHSVLTKTCTLNFQTLPGGTVHSNQNSQYKHAFVSCSALSSKMSCNDYTNNQRTKALENQPYLLSRNGSYSLSFCDFSGPSPWTMIPVTALTDDAIKWSPAGIPYTSLDVLKHFEELRPLTQNDWFSYVFIDQAGMGGIWTMTYNDSLLSNNTCKQESFTLKEKFGNWTSDDSLKDCLQETVNTSYPGLGMRFLTDFKAAAAMDYKIDSNGTGIAFHGLQLSRREDEPMFHPCLNNGHGNFSREQGYICTCSSGSTGPYCEKGRRTQLMSSKTKGRRCVGDIITTMSVSYPSICLALCNGNNRCKGINYRYTVSIASNCELLASVSEIIKSNEWDIWLVD